jgi:hypothetical protein
VIATGMLASIAPQILTATGGTPTAGQAWVRFFHASPDAPAVDIAVAGGAVLFANVAFNQGTTYLPVPAGTYDLEARVAGIAERGIEPADDETYSNGVRKVTYRDADGNEVGFGGGPSEA